MEEKPVLQFGLLGVFSCREIKDGQTKPGSVPDKQGKKALSFFQYLIVNHARRISSEELIDRFWPETDSSNPANSLKNMMFKTRNVLKLMFPEVRKPLLTLQGCFAWNPDIKVELDSEEFEQICLSMRRQTGEAYLNALLRAVSLYKGDFLLGNDDEWAISLRRYYQTLYLDVCKMVLPILQEKERWAEMIGICERASGVGTGTDTFLAYEMQAFLAMGQPERAIEAYQAFREMLWREFEIEPTEEMEHLYMLAEGMCQNHVEERDILKLAASKELETHAFFCTFGVFQSIVALEKRHLTRSGRSSALLLVSLGRKVAPTTDARRLERILLEGLRTGDPIARLNAGSYLLLLSGASTEDAQMVMERLDRDFHKTYSRSGACISYRIYLLEVEKTVEKEPQITGR